MKWISGDTAPKDGSVFIASHLGFVHLAMWKHYEWRENGEFTPVIAHPGRDRESDKDGEYLDLLGHGTQNYIINKWQPLPEPPENSE